MILRDRVGGGGSEYVELAGWMERGAEGFVWEARPLDLIAGGGRLNDFSDDTNLVLSFPVMSVELVGVGGMAGRGMLRYGSEQTVTVPDLRLDE